MKRVVITGMGFISSVGNDYGRVLESIRECKTGVELFSEFARPEIPIKLAGTIKGFSFPSADFEDWTFPPAYKLRRDQLRPMAPNSLYGYCAMQQSITHGGLKPEEVSNERTGLICASGGSMWMAYENMHVMKTRGVQHCQPMGMVNSIPGSLYINLGSTFKIKGGSLSVASACSSSAHAAGMAYDLISSGRQDIVFVVGAEDCNEFNIIPFASIRALSVQTDPAQYPCAFDKKRDGFVGTGGGCSLVLEDLDRAVARGATIYAEVLGWGQSSDGFNVVAPEPEGEGLSRCMDLAMKSAGVKPEEIDYINAHATSTTVGDSAEIAAIRQTFTGKIPWISSTKSLTGHALSMAGALELGFCALALKEKFTPVSAHITELDPAFAGVPIVTKPIPDVPKVVMSNSSGFGGTNASVILKAAA